MEIVIVICVLLGIGLLAALIWSGDLKKKSDAANLRIAELEDERDDANLRNTGLESERDAANQHNAELGSQLNVANLRIAELDRALGVANQHNAELDSQLGVADQRIVEFENQLDVADQRITELDNQLNVANRRITELDNQLNVANRRISELDGALGVANRRIAELRAELQQVAQSNDNAIRVLYLTTLSLQACGFALRRELERSRSLGENYRNLASAYADFSENIKSRANRRLVKKGVGVALSFIPGLALIDILSDLGDILSVATAADEAVDGLDVNLGDIQESVAASGETSEVSESDIPAGDPNLLPLIPNAQSGVVGALQQNVSTKNITSDLSALDPSELDAFVRDTLQHMKDLVELLTEDKHRKEIEEMINNLQKLDYQALKYPADTSESHRQGEADERTVPF